MLTSVIPYYQRKLQWALFRGTTLTYSIFGIINLLRYTQEPQWTRAVQSLAFLTGALIAWQCAQWIGRGMYIRLAERLGMGGLLFAATTFGLTAPSTFSVACTTAFAIALLFSALSSSPQVAWLWCVVCILLYTAAAFVRQHILAFAFDVNLLIPVYTFPPLIFIVFTYIGIDVNRYLRETLALSAEMKADSWQYRQLLQTMNEGFVIVDEHDVFTFVNDKWCEIFGLSAEEALDQRNEDILTYDAANLEVLRQQNLLRASNQRSTYELQFTRKTDQQVRTVLVSAMPNLDAQGGYRGAICVVMDITARKEAEDALRRERALLSQRVEERTASLQAANQAIQHELAERQLAEREYEMIFNQVPVGIYRSTPAGRQLRANPALVQLNGYTTEAEMVAAVNNIATEWYVEANRRDEFKRLLEEQGSLTNFESEIYRHKTRERIWISESAILVRDKQGAPLYYQGTVEDITKRKEIAREQELLIAELAKAAQMKNEFLASMSHELRTPLHSILGTSEVLSNTLYGPLNPKQLDALHTISQSGQHLLALINDILDLAKVEAGQTELVRDWVDVNHLCETCLKLVQSSVQKKQLRTYLTADPQVTVIHADERRLRQILLNLLSNAVKFTPEGGSVGIEVSGVREQSASVQFAVWDTGVGIPQSAMDRLFRPFVQLDSRLARQFEGTGLGLALVYRMAELHGGSVAVQSEVGQGSRFTVTLPWVEPARSEGKTDTPEIVCADANVDLATVPAADEAEDRPLILVVDDNRLTVQVLEDYLEFHHYQVEIAGDGVQALAKVRVNPPHLILMDMQMPGMDGLEAMRRIRSDPKLNHIPIIALTALTMPGDKERCLAAGANAYLSKPVSLHDLHSVVEQELNRRLASLAQSASDDPG